MNYQTTTHQNIAHLLNDPHTTANDQTLRTMAEVIRPVARFKIEGNVLVEDKEGELYFITMPEDLRGQGVNREPKATRPASDLVELTRIDTYHAQSSMLNASFDEVLAQIPLELWGKTTAFEVTHDFPCKLVLEGMNAYHQAQTILYGQG